ncbi:hypothetical protein [Pseudoalteromonas sp. Z1A8]|uniref:hypothetical protein n=1 Tax=Pseudoalteromonas sp. Z1A8 TaxID=2686354 RepID=UPI00140A9283|nr:hypothetical protein [Pseudoalteromonas sp. Z1A8]
MFKKTLLALALTSVAGFANAAELTVTSSNISVEGSVGASSVAVAPVKVKLAAEYTVGDTIKFNVTGAQFDTVESAPDLALTPETGSASAGLLSVTSDTVTFRITAASSPVTFTDGFAELSGMEFKTTSVTAAGKVEVAYSAATSTGIALDAGTKNATLATKVSQISSSATKKLDAVIDVENERKQFTTGNDSITTDTLVITPKIEVASVNPVTTTGATHVIKGNFSWMESDGDAGIDAAELAAAFTATGGTLATPTINTAGDAITVVATGVVAPMTATFTVLGKANAKAPILPTQMFTIDSAIKYNTAAGAAATKTIASASAGAWTLNGFDENIVFMPFDAQYAQSINVSNTGSVAGAITVDITAGGKTYTKTLTATATPKATTNISAEVKAFATESGVTGNAHVKVVVNSPANDIEVTGVYYAKADGDRVKTK